MSFDAERPQLEDSLAETFDARPYAPAPFSWSCFSRTPVEPTKIIPAISNAALIAESVERRVFLVRSFNSRYLNVGFAQDRRDSTLKASERLVFVRLSLFKPLYGCSSNQMFWTWFQPNCQTLAFVLFVTALRGNCAGHSGLIGQETLKEH
jgi:hypothetical protein